MTTEFIKILAAFGCSPKVEIRRLGDGNINETYLVDVPTKPFVLQRINPSVFPDPAAVVHNFAKLHRHFRSISTPVTNSLVMAGPVYTKYNTLSVVDDSGAHWRAQDYIKTHSVQHVRQKDQVSSIGRTLAQFHSHFSTLDHEQLADPLPGFHQLLLYLQAYDTNAGNDVADINKSVSFCHNAAERYRAAAGVLERERQRGNLVPQIVHGDPKADNFIYDGDGCTVGLLDLDTVAGGLVYHDLGDCLRSVCSLSGESITERKKPEFDLTSCEWLLDGYVSIERAPSGTLLPDCIYGGLLAICFELAVRFFTDHLQGNTYFRVEQDGDNLIKATKQFLLCEDIIAKKREILKTVSLVLARQG